MKKPKRAALAQRKRKVAKLKPWVSLKTDPYEISPDIIPARSSYQWCVWEIEGIPDKGSQKKWLEGGWKHVPASRHPSAPIDHLEPVPKEHRGLIYLDGQMLMERPFKVTEAAQAKQYAIATEQIDGTRRRLGIYKPLDTLKAQQGEDIPASVADYTPPDRPFEPTVVEATIKVTLTTREVEIACACKMTNERYAQNKLTLLLKQAFNPEACAFLVPSKNETFAFAGLKIQAKPE